MNVAACAFLFSTQRVPAELRQEPRIATRSVAELKKIRAAQKIAPGQGVASEPERREPFAGRPQPRRPLASSTRPLPQRDDERGRLLDVYC